MSPFEAVIDEGPRSPVVEPDLSTKIRYRLGWPIAEQYRGWVERDVESHTFPLWQLMYSVVGQAFAVWLLSRLFNHFNPWLYFVGGVIGAAGASFFFRDYKRRRFLESYEKRWKKIRERDDGPDLGRFP